VRTCVPYGLPLVLKPEWRSNNFFLEESIIGKPALLQILTLGFAVDFSQLFVLGEADCPLFVITNRCIPIVN